MLILVPPLAFEKRIDLMFDITKFYRWLIAKAMTERCCGLVVSALQMASICPAIRYLTMDRT